MAKKEKAQVKRYIDAKEKKGLASITEKELIDCYTKMYESKERAELEVDPLAKLGSNYIGILFNLYNWNRGN